MNDPRASPVAADVNDSIVQSYEREQEIARQPSRIQETGHRVESLWEEVLSEWLPPQYGIGKRKYLMLETEDGPARTGEIDLVIFHPHYPMKLRTKSVVLASGVAAVFSCKRTIQKKDIVAAYEDAAVLRRGMRVREGTPRHHLAPPVFFGLLGESHCWKESTDPKKMVRELATKLDSETVEAPRLGLDMLCIADLGYWGRSTSICAAELFRNMQLPIELAMNPPQQLIDLMNAGDLVMSGLRHKYDDEQALAPLTHFIGSLWSKLAINDPTLRPLADGLRLTETYPTTGSLAFKYFKLADVTTPDVAASVARKHCPNSDWMYLF